MKLLRTINRLKDPRDLWLFLQILFTLIALPRKISRQSLPGLLAGLDPGVAPVPHDRKKMEKTAGFIDSLLKYRPFQRYGHCLLRSLVLFKFLRRQGWPVSIHFGVKKTGEAQEGRPATAPAGAPERIDITGHSWLVFEGQPFLETEAQEGAFAETYHYPR